MDNFCCVLIMGINDDDDDVRLEVDRDRDCLDIVCLTTLCFLVGGYVYEDLDLAMTEISESFSED